MSDPPTSLLRFRRTLESQRGTQEEALKVLKGAYLKGSGWPPSCLSVQLTSTSCPALPRAMDTWWQKRWPFT